ncbi:hypothetical protein KI387_040498, partial [Taxus chinensis]
FRRTPTSSPLPSPTSCPTSCQRLHLQVLSNSDSEVPVVGSSFEGVVSIDVTISPPLSPGQPCLDFPVIDPLVPVTSLVSSSDLLLSEALLGLATLYLDSPDSRPMNMEEEFLAEGQTVQLGTDEVKMVDSEIIHHDMLTEAHPKVEDTQAGSNSRANDVITTDDNTQPEDSQVDMVSSILSKLQRSFTILKAWEAYTNNIRTAITKYCSKLIALADLLAEESGSIHAKNIVKELKNLL